MLRGILLLSAALIALAVVPAAIADKPVQVSEDVPFPDCGFPVLAHFEGGEINRTTSFGKAGGVRLFGAFPGQTSTWTNLDSGKSITLSDAGSFQLRLEPDGSGTAVFTGHGPMPDFIVGKPGIWYLDGGQVTATGDAQGNVTSVVVRGRLVDLCGQLAS